MIYVFLLLSLISSTLAEVFTLQIFAQSDNPEINGLALVAQNMGSSCSISLSNTTQFTTILAYDTNTSLLLYQSGGSTYYLDTVNGTLTGVPLSNTDVNSTMILINSANSSVSIQCNNETMAEELGFTSISNFSTVLNTGVLSYGSAAFPIYVSPNILISPNQDKISYNLVYKKMNTSPTVTTSAVALLTDSLLASTTLHSQTTASASSSSLLTTATSKASGHIKSVAPITTLLSVILLSIL